MAHSLLAPLLVLAAALGPGVHPGDELPRAPDGHAGLGARTPLRDLLELFRSRKGEGRELLVQLAALPDEVRRQVESLTPVYRAMGAFELLRPGGKPGVQALHEEFARLERDPLQTLARGDVRARALARLLADVRFRVRADLAAAVEPEARELEAALAVLRAAAEGYVTLGAPEAEAIAARADLAASRLRALRNDLEVLRPGASTGAQGDAVRASVLLGLAKLPQEAARAAIAEQQAELARAAERMRSALFSTRLEPRVAGQLDARARARDRAAALLAEARVLSPDTPEGLRAPEEIQRLKRHARVRYAGYRAREGLVLDPLHSELAWLAAQSADLLDGTLESRPLFDRFLVLRGIRFYDHTTLRRELDEREELALSAVQRDADPFAPAGPGGPPSKH